MIGTILINKVSISVFFGVKGEILSQVYTLVPQIPYPEALTPTQELAAWYSATESITAVKEQAYHDELIESWRVDDEGNITKVMTPRGKALIMNKVFGSKKEARLFVERSYA